MATLDPLIADLNRLRDDVVDIPDQRSQTYRFGARNLRVSARAASAGHLPDDGLVAVPGHPAGARLFILEADEAAALTFPVDTVLAPYGGLVDSVATEWLILRNPDSGRVLALDTVRRIGLYYPGVDVPPRDRAEFCRPLLHWLAVLEGNVVIHAGGVAKDGRGLLIAGAGNAGKTTLTRICLAAGFDLLGDNVVEVSLAEAPRLYPVYPTFKVRRDPLLAVPRSWPEPKWDDEAQKDIYFLGAAAATDAESYAHSATLILDATGPSAPEKISSARSLFLIAPNTVAQFPLLESQVLQRTGAVVNSAPTFVAGRMPIDDIVRIVESLLLRPPTTGGVHGH